jgi:NAD+ kinase
VKVFGLVLHESRASDLARTTIEWLIQRDHEVRLLLDDADRSGHPELGVPSEDFAVGMDLLVSLGGDGTMLKSAELAAEDDVPVLGVNLGTLGYLTEVEPSGVRMALKRFLSGSYKIEERMRLSADVTRLGSTDVEHSTALNEVVIEKSVPGHTVRMDVELDRRPFTSWVADGLILSTPTGSTAYSFSVRGPIVDPTHEAVIMAPVAPHMLFDRSMVLRPDCEVRVTVAGTRDCGLSIDGRPQTPLAPGEAVACVAAPKPSRFITFGEHDFHGVLRTKFGLIDR